MLTYHSCSKCDAPVRRSRRRNMWEFVLAAVMLPYRCTVCDRREMKLRFIDMEPNAKSDDTDLIFAEPTEKELEEVRKAEAKAAEKAAKKAEKLKSKEETKKAKKEAPVVVSMDDPEPEEDEPAVSHQSNTSAEAEEQISKN